MEWFDEQTSSRPYFEHSSKLTWLIRDFTIQDRLKVDITSSMSKFHARCLSFMPRGGASQGEQG